MNLFINKTLGNINKKLGKNQCAIKKLLFG